MSTLDRLEDAVLAAGLAHEISWDEAKQHIDALQRERMDRRVDELLTGIAATPESYAAWREDAARRQREEQAQRDQEWRQRQALLAGYYQYLELAELAGRLTWDGPNNDVLDRDAYEKRYFPRTAPAPEPVRSKRAAEVPW